MPRPFVEDLEEPGEENWSTIRAHRLKDAIVTFNLLSFRARISSNQEPSREEIEDNGDRVPVARTAVNSRLD